MVKWKNRTKEDQERILKEQQQQKENKKRRFTHPLTRLDDNEALEIYKDGKIPIACPDCKKWTWCEKYVIKDGEPPMIGSPIIMGKCHHCGRLVRRIWTAMGTMTEAMLMGPAMYTLQRKGLLEDLRTPKGEQ